MKRKQSQMNRPQKYSSEWKLSINNSLAEVVASRTEMAIFLDGVNMGTAKAMLAHNVSPERMVIPEHLECIHDAHVSQWAKQKQAPLLLNQCVSVTTEQLSESKVCLAYLDLMGNSKTGFDIFCKCVNNLTNSMVPDSVIAVTFAARSRTGITIADLETMCLAECKKVFGNVQQGWSPYYKIGRYSMGMIHFQFHINSSKHIEPLYSLCKTPERVDILGSQIIKEEPLYTGVIDPKKIYTLCKYAGFPNAPAEWHANDTLTFA